MDECEPLTEEEQKELDKLREYFEDKAFCPNCGFDLGRMADIDLKPGQKVRVVIGTEWFADLIRNTLYLWDNGKVDENGHASLETEVPRNL